MTHLDPTIGQKDLVLSGHNLSVRVFLLAEVDLLLVVVMSMDVVVKVVGMMLMVVVVVVMVVVVVVVIIMVVMFFCFNDVTYGLLS